MQLRARRLERGISQRELARAVGLTRQAIGAIEVGRAQPSVAVALTLADALDSSVEALFGGQSGPTGEASESVHAGARPAIVTAIGGTLVSRALDPGEPVPPPASAESILFVAGCDVALRALCDYVNAQGAARAVWFSASNRDALAELHAGRVHAAGVHVADDELERFVAASAGTAYDLVELAAVDEGWLVAPDAPRPLRDPRRLPHATMRIANRPRGAAARALLDAELCAAGRDPASVPGYRRELRGQLDVAHAVANGYADVAIGMRSTARLFGLTFFPLRRERCLLAIRRERDERLDVLVSALRSAAYRRALASFDGYDTATTGEALATT
jgi:molybdate-binding protein/DNA-binding XRE family transcriptional regulator